MASDVLDSEKVIIMGEEVRDSHKGREHGDLFWGLSLIFSGVILFFNTLGVVPWSIWSQLWRVWPMFIILAGLRIVLGKSAISNIIIGAVTIIFFAVLAVYALYATVPELLPALPPDLEYLMHKWQTYDINET